MRKVAIIGLAVLALIFVSKHLAAQTVTYTSTSVSADNNGKATFTLAGPNGSETLLVLECGTSAGEYNAQLIVHFDQYGAEQNVGFSVPCSDRVLTSPYPFHYSQYLTGSPSFSGELTLNNVYPPNNPTPITLQINSANWTYLCQRYKGCPASGSASITITGSF